MDSKTPFDLWRPFGKIPHRPTTEKPASGAWWVSEKVHGAHFSVLCDGESVRFGKRSAVLGPGERFFGYETIAGKLTLAVRKAWGVQAAKMPAGELKLLAVHGELYGGSYPRPAGSATGTAETESLRPIQTGIWYSPRIEFLAFDVALYSRPSSDASGGSDKDTTALITWLSLREMTELLSAAGMPAVEPLFTGKRSDALAFNPRFCTRIPARHGLASIDGNLSEGIVVRPSCGARQLVKIKNREFAELDDAVDMASHSADLTPILARVCRNRFDAVRSKLGDGAAASELTAAVISDVMEELYEDAELAAWVARLTPEDFTAAERLADASVASWLFQLEVAST